MLPFKSTSLFIVMLGLISFSSSAQLDSTSSETISEYREDTLFWQEITIQNYLEGKLIYERKQKGVGRDEFEYAVLNNYYDHNGELRESVLVERDGYECPPKVSNGLFSNFGLTEPMHFQLVTPVSVGTPNGLMLPDSLPDDYQFCGRYMKKVTQHERYLHVSHIEHFYDDDPANQFIDSTFFNRFGDKIRYVRYKNGELSGEELFAFKYDERGRVLEKVWRNLTVGYEYEQVSHYKYVGEVKLSTYNSSLYFNQPLEKEHSITEHYDNNKTRKFQRFVGDSLISSYFYSYFDSGRESGGSTVDENGDTIGSWHFVELKHRNGIEKWSHQFRYSEDVYEYFARDSTSHKDGHQISVECYQITKAQFDERQKPNKRNNALLYRKTTTFDKQGRVIREEELDDHFGEKEVRYEYSGN